jgi:plasmid maintenance system antidote protein VapI
VAREAFCGAKARCADQSAPFWLNLQTLYDLRLAQQKTGEAIKSLPRLKRREPVPA